MGHTHSFRMRRDDVIDLETFASIRAEAQAILEITKATVCGLTGEESPVLDEDSIELNGSKLLHESAEPLLFYRDPARVRWAELVPDDPYVYGHVKTYERAYDGVALAILLVAKYHLGERICIQSDARQDEIDRPYGRAADAPTQLYHEATGRTASHDEMLCHRPLRPCDCLGCGYCRGFEC